jgi:hypothetical protein
MGAATVALGFDVEAEAAEVAAGSAGVDELTGCSSFAKASKSALPGECMVDAADGGSAARPAVGEVS